MAMAAATRAWTLEELHRLPDDGNRYELVRGELFVTPPPDPWHETLGARLSRLLVRYVEAHGLGHVYHPRSVIREEGSELEPDLMVRHPAPRGTTWEAMPRPVLVVEILSPTTRRRDRGQKRAFYRDVGVAEYWMIDPEREAVTVARPEAEDVEVTGRLEWHPAGAGAPFVLDVRTLLA